jgi:hypothetical protein
MPNDVVKKEADILLGKRFAPEKSEKLKEEEYTQPLPQKVQKSE